MSDQKVKTGVPGLDGMLEGGFPHGRVVVVMGGPGTGKTILCSQYLHHGATQQNEKCIYIALNESKPRYLMDIQSFGLDLERLEKEGKFMFVDATSVRRIPEQAKVGRIPVGGKELGLVNLVEIIETANENFRPNRIVLDSVSDLVFRFPKAEERRPAVLDIVEALTASGSTCLLTSEFLSTSENRGLQPEEYLSDGVIVLQTLRTGKRAIQILKMRGTKVDTSPRPYTISKAGIEVFSDENVYQS